MQFNDTVLCLPWKKFQQPSIYVYTKLKSFEKPNANLKYLCSTLAGRNVFFTTNLLLLLLLFLLKSKQGVPAFLLFPASYFYPLSLFGKGVEDSENDISLTCGPPPVRKWLTENDKCKKEDAGNSYWTHEHCIHVQIWKPSRGVCQSCSCMLHVYRIEEGYIYKI